MSDAVIVQPKYSGATEYSGAPEYSHSRLVRIARAIAARPDIYLPAVAMGVILWTTRIMWGPELAIAGDDLPHLSAEAQIRGILSEGGNPFGPLGLLFGTPLLRFYQSMFYLTSSVLTLMTGFHAVSVHNALVIFCFAASPWTTVWGFRRMGLSRLAAGIGALLVMTSVAGFGNSFEAYYRDGVVTQGMGALFFPLFLGAFASLLQGKGSGLRAGVMFAIGLLAHAPLAIFAVFTGVVMFFTTRWPSKRIWKQLVIFGLLAASLTVFWVIPFISYTERYRPITDSVMRANRVWWFTGVTNNELHDLLFTGRVFDDAHTPLGAKVRHPNDLLIDKLNMGSTRYVRPPFMSIIILFSFIYSLFHLRRRIYRMCASVFALSLLLYLGADDVPWLGYLPFGSRIMGFRTTYLLELFGYALAGLTLADLGKLALKKAREFRPMPRRALIGALGVLGLTGVVFVSYHSHHVGRVAVKHLRVHALNRLVAAAEPARAGFPLRIQESYPTGARHRWSMLSHQGQAGICGHFWGLGPESTFYGCGNLRSVENRYPLSRRSGIGYQLSAGKRTKVLEKARSRATRRGKPGELLFEKVNAENGHTLWLDRNARFLQAIERSSLVISEPEPWMNVVRAWIRNHRQRGMEPPTTVLWRPELDASSIALDVFEMIFVLDDLQLTPELIANIATFANNGGTVWSVVPIDGAEVNILNHESPPIAKLLTVKPTTTVFARDEDHGHRWIRGPYAATFDMPKDGFVLLPSIHMPGWQATVDGNPVPTFAAAADYVVAPVPAGTHRVRFEWSMAPFERYPMWISGMAWAIVLLLGLLYLGQWTARIVKRRPARQTT